MLCTLVNVRDPRDYVRRNDAMRARLVALAARATDADLARPMPDGWTVAAVLLHCAFWDERIVVLLDRWQREGATPPPETEDDVRWINDASKPLMLAMPVRRAAELAIETAERSDRTVAALSEDFISRNNVSDHLNLSRSEHRGEHLDEIERVLGPDPRV